jgi:ketosteroid isomerase-like protein
VVIGRYSAKMKPSGHQYASGWVMLFTVKNGKIAKFAEYSDSAQLIRAYTGATVGA